MPVLEQQWGGTRFAVALVVGVAMSLLGGCQSGDDPEAQETTTTVAAPPTTAAAPSTTSAASTATTAPVRPDMSPDEIAVRNTLEMFAVEQTLASLDPDPDHPGVNALTTGEFKQKVRESLEADQRDGVYYRRDGDGPNPHRTEHVRFEGPDVAIAMECHLDDRLLYRKGTDELIDGAIKSFRLETRVQREADQVWRVAYVTILREVPGAKECYGLG